jgi:serine/threonine-protein kinase HipA
MSIEVHVDWQGEAVLVGRLYSSNRNPTVAFEYAADWLNRKDAFSIDPASLPLGLGKHYRKTLFGAMQDCGPDRWGRMLIQRAVRKGVLRQKPYYDIDYVLELEDLSRVGALRFRTDSDSPFLAPAERGLPPIVELAALKRASDAIQTETETAKDLRFLLGYGSPLGGARPKSAVRLQNKKLGIAKFPKPDDVRNVAAGEILGLELAREAGIEVAEHELVPGDAYTVAVITRFDREEDRRIPFISGASLLAVAPNELASYAQLADAIRQYGHDVSADLPQLWRRMVFSLLASNYDDHLRNHGFLMREPGRWSLSPAYDINPTPEVDRSDINKTPISEDQTELSVAGALKVAPRFGLKLDKARNILDEVLSAVSQWEDVACRLKFKNSISESYSSAFIHPLVDEAKKLLGK